VTRLWFLTVAKIVLSRLEFEPGGFFLGRRFAVTLVVQRMYEARV
jgi:hypothetical protein